MIHMTQAQFRLAPEPPRPRPTFLEKLHRLKPYQLHPDREAQADRIAGRIEGYRRMLNHRGVYRAKFGIEETRGVYHSDPVKAQLVIDEAEEIVRRLEVKQCAA